MRPLFLASLLALVSLGALVSLARGASAEEARWIRYPALSPDGSRVVLAYGGDLWLVPAGGGEARALTSHVAYETSPVWSPDGTHIAFASDRHGNFDVFVVSAEGGRARRLTWHSSDDVPTDFGADGTRVLFVSRRQDAPEAALAGSWQPELYSVATSGGDPLQILTTPALAARVGPDGRHIAYEDLKGYESAWRKHHTSSVARDLWLYDDASGTHRQLTSHAAEDRSPVWSGAQHALTFLSERSGSFEVWKMGVADPAHPGTPTQVTTMGEHPVRFLSAARDGTLAFAYDGDLWVKRSDAEPLRVPVSIALDDRENRVRPATHRKGATEIAVAPSGEEVAFVVRGEVFVTSVEHDTTKRITSTPEQERSLTWSPDGRTLYYASERSGSWNLYASRLAREDEEAFCRATKLEERTILADEYETFQPRCSPDGKHLVFVRDRDTIAVLDLEDGTSRVLVPAKRNYSYVDGDIDLAFSPDGRWLAFTMLEDGRWIDAVGVVEVASGEIVNVTRSGYDERNPRWSADGRNLTFVSSRHGRRAHASRSAEADVLGLSLTRAAFDRARLDEEDYDLLHEEEEKARKARRRKGRDDEDDEDEAPEPSGPVAIEFEHLEDRLRRLTAYSAPLGDHALSTDGERVFFTAKVGNTWAVWATKIREQSTERLEPLGTERPGELVLARNGKRLFVRRGNGTILKLDVGGSGGRGPRGRRGARSDSSEERSQGGKDVAFRAEMETDGPAERAHLFQHVWRQTLRKFYDPELHGVDWEALGRHYAAFLPHITNDRDLAELLSEMLGELNASHTGARFRPRERRGAKTASLGLLFHVEQRGDGLRVAEVLRGGPADRAASRLRPGSLLRAIDGVPLTPDTNTASLLDRKAGKRVLLALEAPDGASTWEEVLEPVTAGEERTLLYERWVKSRERLTETLSDGRVGYVHVRGMGDGSYRRAFREALGRHGAKEALIVDTRFNGGGWLHDDLVGFLGGRPYAWFVPRGKTKGQMGREPNLRWARPVAVIQNEANYSDAHFFPFAFQALGMGKLVGARVAGTSTAVWWERLMNPDLVFGIPQVGMVTADGRYLENRELVPDIEVHATPEQAARGEDPQLAAAVEALLG